MPLQLDDLRHPASAGLVGALISLRWVPGTTYMQRATNVGSGWGIAYFCGPIVAEFFGMTTPSSQLGLGFALGLFGVNLVAVVMDTIKLKLGPALADVIARRL